MDISVVVPIYGCRDALPQLHSRLVSSLEKLTKSFEIIFVNDACPQNSWEEIERICKTDSRVIGIEMSRNFGQMKAILAGLDRSKGDWVVVMDCDLQDRPEEIERLYNKALEGYDAVFARRKARKDSFTKVLVSKCFYKIYSIATDANYDPALCNFSVCSRKVIDAYCSMRESHRAFVMYVKWLGFRHAIVDVEHNERFSGKSGYNFKKRINMAMEILTSQSDKLLKLTVKAGMAISIISLLFVLVTIIRYFFLNIAAGYSSLIAAIFFMGGLTVVAVGMVGLYVGNIFMEVKGRPLYVVRTVLGGEEGKDE